MKRPKSRPLTGFKTPRYDKRTRLWISRLVFEGRFVGAVYSGKRSECIKAAQDHAKGLRGIYGRGR